jgi:transcriptional regulator with XRE-family HTH domain
MVARDQLMKAPPYPVEQALSRLGDNLRTTKIRRNHTIEEVAEKIGTGRRAVMDAEKGKAWIGIGVYAALSLVFDLLAPLDDLANPAKEALECGDQGRYANATNILSRHARFLLDRGEAEKIVNDMKAQVDATSHDTMRAICVSEEDAATIRGAFVYPGFSL